MISTALLGLVATSYFFIDSRKADDITALEPIENTLLARKILSEKDQTAEQKSSNQRSEPITDVAPPGYEGPVIPQERDIRQPDFEKTEAKKVVTPLKRDSKSPETDYLVVKVAHFYSQPDVQTRRKGFINYWNNSYASIKPLDEKNGFIYVVFKNHLGQTTKGWLRKKDLKKVNNVYENTKE